MTTIRITDNSAGAQGFIDYARTLPFAIVEEQATPKKMTFEEACEKYNCISVDEFVGELKERIAKW